MKYILLLAIVSGEAYAKHHSQHRSIQNLVQSSSRGIDKKHLQPDRHWNLPWPQGIDDSTDDDKIMLPGKKEKEVDAPLRYFTKGR